jgi:hypothetical protein
MKRLAGLLLGPIIILLCILVLGPWGLIIGMFVGLAATFFIPLFGFVTTVLNIRSLPGLLIVANLAPLLKYLRSDIGSKMPSYSWAEASPQYIAASSCAVVLWLFVRRKPNKGTV